MIEEHITDKLIAKINAELEVEHNKLQTCIGKTLRKSEIEEEMICDIYISYYQTPLCEIEDIIKKVAPFLDELGVTLNPYVGDARWSYDYADCDATVAMSLRFIEVEGWNKLDGEQKEQVEELCEELRDLYYKLNFGMTLDLREIESEEDDDLEEDLEEDSDSWLNPKPQRDPEYRIISA